ncbi:MAG: alpha-N-acetylglucosaminidase TIM-barrel domain-containing protein, partial [Bacteroidales bacterium]|nr:alpha-N-acetylglucosaminidase TIM-barrel domain-containing protein [Bacteroidales bacterium]
MFNLNKKKILDLILGCLFIFSTPSFSLETRKPEEKAAMELIQRVLPSHSDKFEVALIAKEDDKDLFEIESVSGKIILRGNNGISIASALNYYLKNYAHCQITWNGTNLNLPDPLPIVPEKIQKKSPYKYRYYLNYCTFNYSMSWWDWNRWQKEIDWMALNGINMPLAVTGQNSIWQRVYKSLGFTDKELECFFSGPAYFNWFWMGNLDGWGGPLPQSFMDQHEALQKKILQRERSFGMTPILPAFTGHVPPTFQNKFPEAKIKKTKWGDFSPVCILDPSEPLFTEIGKRFIEEEIKVYGTDHLYSADTFNENTPPTKDSVFLNDVSRKVYQSMASADPKATWIMQGWMFHHQRNFWGAKEIQALLNAIPNDHMIILDLYSELHPVWNRTKAYYGKPWIWCMLHNFGKNISMSGIMSSISQNPAKALNDPKAGKMMGIGLTPEGIEQNPVLYDLMLENVWRNTPIDLESWLKDYAFCRYGKKNMHAERAWDLLSKSVYADSITSGGPESIITARPTFA